MNEQEHYYYQQKLSMGYNLNHKFDSGSVRDDMDRLHIWEAMLMAFPFDTLTEEMKFQLAQDSGVENIIKKIEKDGPVKELTMDLFIPTPPNLQRLEDMRAGNFEKDNFVLKVDVEKYTMWKLENEGKENG